MKAWAVAALVTMLLVSLVVGGLILIPRASESAVAAAESCSGGQALSIDSINLRDSPELGRKVIRVVFSTITTGDCLDIVMDAATTQDKLREAGVKDFKATKAIQGDIILTKKQKVYNIGETADRYYKLAAQPISLGFGQFCTNAQCTTKTGKPAIASVLDKSLSGTCQCVYEDEQGVGAEFLSSSQLQWEAKVIIGGQSETLSNSKLSGRVGDRALIKWAGNLNSNDALDSINREAYKPYSDNQFRVVDDGTASSLRAEFDRINRDVVACDTSGLASCPNELASLGAYNARFDSSTRDGLQSWIDRETNVADGTHIESNRLIVDLESPIAYPTFTIDIDAAEVGIFVTSGEPKVTCPAGGLSFVSGQTKDAKINIKNVGKGNGAFSYELSCDKGSQTLSPSPPQSIAVGKSIDVRATVGLTVQEGIEESSCTFTATDLNSLKSDSCSFDYGATKQSKCVAGHTSCEIGNAELWTCRSDGSYDKTACTYGCEAFEDGNRCRLQASEVCSNGIDDDGNGVSDASDPTCASTDDSSESTCGTWVSLRRFKIPNLWCKLNEFFKAFKLIIAGIVGALAGLLGLTFGYSATRNLSPKARWITALVASVLIGIAAGVIAFLYFWVGVLVLIITILVRLFVPL